MSVLERLALRRPRRQRDAEELHRIAAEHRTQVARHWHREQRDVERDMGGIGERRLPARHRRQRRRRVPMRQPRRNSISARIMRPTGLVQVERIDARAHAAAWGSPASTSPTRTDRPPGARCTSAARSPSCVAREADQSATSMFTPTNQLRPGAGSKKRPLVSPTITDPTYLRSKTLLTRTNSRNAHASDGLREADAHVRRPCTPAPNRCCDR